MTNNLGDALATDPEVSPLAAKIVAPKRVRIVLEENENIPPTGQFFGHNGNTYLLRPGDEADVPVEILTVLNDAVQDVPQLDPTTRQVVGYRKKLRFPYRVVQPQAA
jgi:hypothetical protein